MDRLARWQLSASALAASAPSNRERIVQQGLGDIDTLRQSRQIGEHSLSLIGPNRDKPQQLVTRHRDAKLEWTGTPVSVTPFQVLTVSDLNKIELGRGRGSARIDFRAKLADWLDAPSAMHSAR
jgi:hypothetical protein